MLKRDGERCRVCLKPAQCVHHIDYKKRTLAGEQDSSLISLCNDCHHAVEWQGEDKISASAKQLKWQLLNALMLKKRGFGLAVWQGRKPRRKRPKAKPPNPKRANRKELAEQMRKQHAAIGAAADQSLRRWRSMPHWERTNYLAAS